MTSKERRQREAKLYHEARKEVLASDDPEIWINRDGLEMSLGIALDGIYNYIDSCLWMDDNPLRYLRRYFPGFTWKFHEDVRVDDLTSVLDSADYIWVTGLEVGDGFITATQISGVKPRMLCFLSRTGNYSGWNTMIKRDLRMWVPNIRFVEDGSDKDANTIIT